MWTTANRAKYNGDKLRYPSDLSATPLERELINLINDRRADDVRVARDARRSDDNDVMAFGGHNSGNWDAPHKIRIELAQQIERMTDEEQLALAKLWRVLKNPNGFNPES
jgi:hypothetical protein